jgi:hypothetical protein
MPNPSGTVYLQANTGYTWTDGDVYEIPQTDEVEGAASGASFSGIGVDNQPHQALLNKIQLVHKNQLTDEANIATLQGQVNQITSKVGVNGWAKLATSDVNLGHIQIIIQWGTISLLSWGQGGGGGNIPTVISFTFPIPFTNAVWMLVPYWQTNLLARIANPLAIAVVSPLQKQGNQIASALASTNQYSLIAGSNNNFIGLTGIGWVALGY